MVPPKIPFIVPPGVALEIFARNFFQNAIENFSGSSTSGILPGVPLENPLEDQPGP